MMHESDFLAAAEAMQRRWFDALEAAEPDALDVDFENGILTVEAEGIGTFVLSKHAPTRQLWLSSPLSGASHYQYDAARAAWLSTRGGGDLDALLEAEFARAAGMRIAP